MTHHRTLPGRSRATAALAADLAPSRITPLRALLVAALAAVLLAAWSPAPSDAATYTVWSCRGPAGEPLSTVAWTAGGDGGTRSDTCATGGTLRASLGAADVAGGVRSGFRLALPAGSSLASWRVWMTASVAATTDDSSYGAGVSQADALGAGGFTAGCLVAPGGCTWGAATDPLGDVSLASGSASASGLALSVRCLTSTGCSPATAPAADVSLARSAVDVLDDDAPVVGPLTGELVAGAPIDRPASVVAPVADAGGGVRNTDLLVDGAVAQTGPSGGVCATPYVLVRPCPAQIDRAFTVDPAALAAGVHTVAARATDAAGNVTDGPASTFVVGERPTPAPVTPTGAPGTGGASGTGAPGAGTGTGTGTSAAGDLPATGALVLSLPARASVPERRRTTGTARWTTGGVAAGVRLDVLAGGLGRSASALRRIGRVTTAADGTFVLPRSTTSRTLRVAPTDDALDARPADVDLVAPLSVSLRGPAGVTHNGSSATLRGTVDGAGDAAPDLQVLVQSIVRGSWTTVASVEPGPTGNVVWRYRFLRTTRRSAYRFRFVVLATKSLPWGRVTSPRRIVRVSP